MADKKMERIWWWTLVQWDWLDFPETLIKTRDDISLLVEAILNAWWEALLELLYKSKKTSDLLNWMDIQKSNWLNIKQNISKYLLKIESFLLKNNFPSDYITIMIKKLWYELFNAWLKNLVNSAWLSVPKKCVEVPENLRNQISNILLDEDELSSLLIFLTSYWFIELSENIWNNFEEESENKILDIDKSKLIEDLESIWAVKTFEWKVDDDYYDFLDMRLDNAKKSWETWRSFRIREKLDSTSWDVSRYYTIKRKNQKIPNHLLEYVMKLKWRY